MSLSLLLLAHLAWAEEPAADPPAPTTPSTSEPTTALFPFRGVGVDPLELRSAEILFRRTFETANGPTIPESTTQGAATGAEDLALGEAADRLGCGRWITVDLVQQESSLFVTVVDHDTASGLNRRVERAVTSLDDLGFAFTDVVLQLARKVDASPPADPPPAPAQAPATSQGLVLVPLPQALQDPDVGRRIEALIAHQQRADAAAIIYTVLATDPAPAVQMRAWRIARSRWRQKRVTWESFMQIGEWAAGHAQLPIRLEAIEELGERGNNLYQVNPFLTDPDPQIRIAAAAALLNMGFRGDICDEAAALIQEAMRSEQDHKTLRAFKRAARALQQ